MAGFIVSSRVLKAISPDLYRILFKTDKTFPLWPVPWLLIYGFAHSEQFGPTMQSLSWTTINDTAKSAVVETYESAVAAYNKNETHKYIKIKQDDLMEAILWGIILVASLRSWSNRNKPDSDPDTGVNNHPKPDPRPFSPATEKRRSVNFEKPTKKPKPDLYKNRPINLKFQNKPHVYIKRIYQRLLK